MGNLKLKTQKSKLFILFLLPAALVLVFFVLINFRKSGKVGQKPVVTSDSITLEKQGGMAITFRNSGVIEFGGAFSQLWSTEDGSTLYDYIKKKIEAGEYSLEGGLYKVVIDGKVYYFDPGDEVIDTVFDEGESGGGGGMGDLFNFNPTPTPIQSGPTPTDSGGSGSSKKGIDDCPFWRLSYCVYPNPTPTPYIVPTAGILPPECGANLQTGRTVITNELCLSSPTP